MKAEKNVKNYTPEAWEIFLQAAEQFLVSKGYSALGNCLFETPAANGPGGRFFLLPLEEIEELPGCRKKDYQCPVVFLVLSKKVLPARRNENFRYLEELFGNPKFGNTAQAIFRAERIKGNRGLPPPVSDTCDLVNVIDVLEDGFGDRLEKTISFLFTLRKELGVDWMGRFREGFYTSFVNYYALIPDQITGTYQGDTLTVLDAVDKQVILPGKTDVSEESHHRPLEFARAPLAFYLQTMALAARFIADRLKNKKIRLLLLDNRAQIESSQDKKKKNKFIEKTDDNKVALGSLCELLLGEGAAELSDCFEIYMGGTRCRKKDEATGFFVNDEESDKQLMCAYEFDPVDAAFNADNFFGEDESYRDQIFERVSRSHFVLLDFFLNAMNTCLAFDFIEKFSEIKQGRNEPSTTWYFITSAVHDSVTRYAQSGLLAQYYESAVVNAGDDPTNPKRQIIFLYKLLVFIQSRMKSILRHYDTVRDLFFHIDGASCPGICAKCCEEKVNLSGKKEPQHEKCFSATQRCIKRFLAEDDNFASIVIPKYKYWKELFELLDDTITKFQILPQADWQLVQHQIDFMDSKKEFIENRQFCCRYIKAKMELWSEIY